jgi:hypothetical protein
LQSNRDSGNARCGLMEFRGPNCCPASTLYHRQPQVRDHPRLQSRSARAARRRRRWAQRSAPGRRCAVHELHPAHQQPERGTRHRRLRTTPGGAGANSTLDHRRFRLKPLRPPADEDLHELIAERYESAATIVTSTSICPNGIRRFHPTPTGPWRCTTSPATSSRTRGGAVAASA